MAKAQCARLTKFIRPSVTDRPTDSKNNNIPYAMPSNRTPRTGGSMAAALCLGLLAGALGTFSSPRPVFAKGLRRVTASALRSASEGGKQGPRIEISDFCHHNTGFPPEPAPAQAEAGMNGGRVRNALERKGRPLRPPHPNAS